MPTRLITKQLAGEEDFLLGEGSESQERASGSQTINKLNINKWVINAAALTALDVTKFVLAKLGASNIPYRWASGDVQTPDGDFIITGTGGNWLKVVEQPILQDYAEVVVDNLTANGATPLNANSGNVHNLLLTGNITLSVTNVPPAGYACGITVHAVQNGTGGWTIAHPAGTIWVGGSPPALTTAAGTVILVSYLTIDGGTTWLGLLGGNAFA